ncbi:MAG: hypothetical protein IJX49_04965 [Clostridia bacterium]|nr:hypothetical protein [Clostridia bacterium]
MNKKQVTEKEMFYGMARLRDYFQEIDRTISKFDQGEGSCSALKALKEKRRNLFQTAKNMDRTDLQLIYYLHKLEKIYPHQMLHALQKLVNAQEEVKGLMRGEKEKANFQE